LLLLEATPTKATTKKPKTTTTNKQEEVRIYSSRKKKNEEKTNLELLFSSKLLFCSVLFCSVVFYFFSLSSIGLLLVFLSFSSSVAATAGNPKIQKNSKAVVVSVNRRP
jgi:hypothetical protein